MEIHFNVSASLSVPSTVGNACGIDFSQDGIFLPILYGIFFIVGTPLNLLALVGLYKLIQSENVLPVYVINLLIADLIQLLTLPLWIDYYANGHYWRFGPRSCQFMVQRTVPEDKAHYEGLFLVTNSHKCNNSRGSH